jgi:membrane-associated phospholipid phosphatase
MSYMSRKAEDLNRGAEAVSVIFHPFVVVIPTMVIAMIANGNTLRQSLFWTILSIGIVILPMLILIFAGVRSGRYSDPSISMREQRTRLYALAILLLILLLAALIVGKAPLILIACLVSAVLATLIGYVINLHFTKMSLHSVGVAGCATVLLLTAPILGLVMALFAPIVGWARIRLKHHTPLQILIGWAVSLFCVLIVFHFFHLFL